MSATQPQTQQYATAPQGYGQPNIIINNSASANIGGLGLRRRRSDMVHLVLLLTTGGIGNIVYMVMCRGRIR